MRDTALVVITLTSDSPRRSFAVGIVLRWRGRQAGIEPFYAELIAGMEDVLALHDATVLLQVVTDVEEELVSYRRWAASDHVSGVVLGDVVDGDVRINVLSALGMPTLVLGESDLPPGVAEVRVDNYSAMKDAVAELTALGHVRIGRVSGPARFLHTRSRTAAFIAALGTNPSDAGAPRKSAPAPSGQSVEGDYTSFGGASATKLLLESSPRPTAIIYDNDVMAVAGLEVAHKLGIAIPAELSLLAWDDSRLCRLATPAMSAMSRDVHGLGELSAQSLLTLIATGDAPVIVAPPPRFIARGTTATPPPPPN